MSLDSTFIIDLNPAGDGGAFRIKNAPGEITRDHIIDRGQDLVVQANIVEVIHGKLQPNGDPATLIVTEFFFVSTKPGRRFTSAIITYRFTSVDSAGVGPDVIDIAPKGHFSMHQTKKHVESGRSAQLSLQGPAGPVNPGVTFAMDLKQSYDTKDQITLSGTMRIEGREFGGKDTARWALMENGVQKSGIPTEVRTAILLKRRHDEAEKRFHAVVEVAAGVDLVSSLGNISKKVLGRIPKDDPVIFDPQHPLGVREDLAKEDLQKLSAIKITKMLSDAEVGG
jgi:hypothetical protein